MGELYESAQIIEQGSLLKHFQNRLSADSNIVRVRQYHHDNNELVEVFVLRYKEQGV